MTVVVAVAAVEGSPAEEGAEQPEEPEVEAEGVAVVAADASGETGVGTRAETADKTRPMYNSV